MSTQKNWNVIVGVGAVAAIIIAAILIFLFTKDDGYSGVQALKEQSFAFWAFVVLGLAAAVFGVRMAYKGYDATGNASFVIGMLIVIALLIMGPFGRACTDKANGGVTAPGHKTAVHLQHWDPVTHRWAFDDTVIYVYEAGE